MADVIIAPFLIQFFERNLLRAADCLYHPDIFAYKALSSVVVHIFFVFLQTYEKGTPDSGRGL